MALEFLTQVSKPVDYNGLVTANHFYSIYQQKPEVISDMLKTIWKTHLPTSLIEFVNKFPMKEVEQEEGFYYWTLIGNRDKNLPLKDAETVDGSSLTGGTFPNKVGSQGERFFLFFDQPLFEPTNVLRGENEKVHLLVQDMEDVGGMYRYEVELVDAPNSKTSISIKDLKLDSKWVKWYSLTPGTLSYRGAKPYFTSPFKLMNTVSMMRMEYEVPGSSIQKGKNEPLEFGFKVERTGEIISSWINFLDLEAIHQGEEMFARMLVYGRKNWDSNRIIGNKDKNTKWNITSGAGLFQQAEGSSTKYYNEFNIEQFADQCLENSIGKIERGSRVIDVYSGEFGVIQASKAIIAAGGVKIDNNAVRGRDSVSAADTNTMAANTIGYHTPQAVEYSYFNGIKFRFHILDFFDDRTYFPAAPGNMRGTAESYRYLAFNTGGDAGVYRMIPKSAKEEYGYIAGMRDPFSKGGKGSPKMMASPVDGYSVHWAKWGGMMLEDPTKMLDWRKNIQ
jgi:hypothetical protein